MIPLIGEILFLGVLLWFIETCLPLNDTLKRLCYGIIVVVAVWLVLTAFGFVGNLNAPLPRFR